MAKFSQSSMNRLLTCRYEIQSVLKQVIPHYDFAVICGHRTKEDQDAAFHGGYSKVKWPDSKHNTWPSMGVDVAPYPIDWQDHESFYHLAGRILQVADSLGIPMRWGGDWDMDDDLHDQSFFDLGHFELVNVESRRWDDSSTVLTRLDGGTLRYTEIA